MHIPPSLLLDLQALYPPSLVPELIATLPHLYIEFSRDPLVGGAFGYFGGNSHLYWFNNFVWVEALFQLPTFVIGAYGLWKGEYIYNVPLPSQMIRILMQSCRIQIRVPPHHDLRRLNGHNSPALYLAHRQHPNHHCQDPLSGYCIRDRSPTDDASIKLRTLPRHPAPHDRGYGFPSPSAY